MDYVKLSHHAGIKNINYELLSLIKCKNFIISSDGQNHDLPNKATLAELILLKGKGVNFYFNYPSYYYPFEFYNKNLNVDERNLYEFNTYFSRESDRYYLIE